MKKISLQLLSLLFITFFTTNCSDNDTTNDSNINNEPLAYEELLNVSYGNDSSQVYDIYLPENRTLDTKVLILVHGGGWTSGDKLDMNDIKNIARQDLPDYAVVNINYRLASQGVSPFPMQLNDITAVIEHLKTNQEAYVLSNNYGFIGTSAGAHLSMLWTYAYDTFDDVNMVASIVGPTNLGDPAYTNNPQLPINQLMLFFGVTPSTQFLETYSPYHQVTATSAPTILFYGGMDPLIPNSQGIDMDAKLTTLGVTHQFTFYPNEGHGWVGANLLDTWTKLKAFVELHH
ncbi:alpha/beta hydrolase [Olleya sp. YS]|uniref:alpha/beta hydrolase n=1 Tax=Olleya sp. YS TaxID=3028318 RepID=UPI0024345801|nr:alpha/beta hydrolase [Olleya sp. YS]WGD34210.1 alpha/beta hydrolase [Olleya sp. YS]